MPAQQVPVKRPGGLLMPQRGYRKPEDDALAVNLRTRLTPAMKAHLQDCVAASNVNSEADYIRRLIMGQPIRSRASPDRAELIRELNRIGTNINQIAHAANQGLPVPQRDLMIALEQLDEALARLTDMS